MKAVESLADKANAENKSAVGEDPGSLRAEEEDNRFENCAAWA
jgi:hypothetical protein